MGKLKEILIVVIILAFLGAVFWVSVTADTRETKLNRKALVICHKLNGVDYKFLESSPLFSKESYKFVCIFEDDNAKVITIYDKDLK